MRDIFTIHTDSGHGWLRVNLGEAAMLGFKISDFSHYSYRESDNLYLEEDCDMAKFMTAYRNAYGRELVIHEKHVNGSSPIRNFARVKA